MPTCCYRGYVRSIAARLGQDMASLRTSHRTGFTVGHSRLIPSSIWTLHLARHEALDNQGLWLCYPLFRSRSVGKSEPSRTVSKAPDVPASAKKRLAPARGVILAIGIGLVVWALIIACLTLF